MYRIYRGIKDRVENFVTAESFLSANAGAGSIRLEVQDASYFGQEAINNSFPTLLLMDSATTGKKIQGGFEGTELVYIKNIYNNIIELQAPLVRNWNVSSQSKVKRALAGIPIGKVLMGEIAVATKFPYISVNPVRKNISWRTLSGTMDKVSIDFIVYIKDDDTESATELILKASDCLEWILMSNLHIKPLGFTKPYEVTSMAMVTGVNYGTIQKGSEFLKAATLTWEADIYYFRSYLTSQGYIDSMNSGFSSQSNMGPLTN